MLPLRVRVTLGAMAIKRYSAFTKAPVITIRLLSVIPEHSFGESNPSAEMQSVYSAAPAKWDKLSNRNIQVT